jgi:MoaA/NifB/PqqE/SkfB family radical SAM enzyme
MTEGGGSGVQERRRRELERAAEMERSGTVTAAEGSPGAPRPGELRAPARLGRGGALRRILKSVAARRPANTATEVRLTRLCSQRCRQCAIPWGAVPADTMSLPQFREVAAKLRDYGAAAGFISGGEPSLHPDLPAIFEEALRTFPLACTVNSNLDNHTELIRERIGAGVRMGVNVQTSIDGLGALGDDLRGGSGVGERVLRHMEMLSEIKAASGSPAVLYVNTVLNRRNLHQIPRILEAVESRGWRSSIGSYHDLTMHTRKDNGLFLRDDAELRGVIAELLRRPRLMTLPEMLRGLPTYLAGRMPRRCPYLDAPSLASRLLIRENGDLYLCKGKPIGNLFREELAAIFAGPSYAARLREYASCPGCWNNCYTQKLLLVRPPSLRVALENLRFSLGLGRSRRGSR